MKSSFEFDRQTGNISIHRQNKSVPCVQCDRRLLCE